MDTAEPAGFSRAHYRTRLAAWITRGPGRVSQSSSSCGKNSPQVVARRASLLAFANVLGTLTDEGTYGKCLTSHGRRLHESSRLIRIHGKATVGVAHSRLSQRDERYSRGGGSCADAKRWPINFCVSGTRAWRHSSYLAERAFAQQSASGCRRRIQR